MARIVRVRTRDIALVLQSPSLFDRRLDRQATFEFLRDPANVFLLAIEDEHGVGFLRGTSLRQLHSRRAQMFLYEIEVLRRFRRRGIARSLIEWLLRYCRRAGFEEIFVLTSPGNRPAVALYRATGAETETDADRMYVYHLNRSTRAKRAGAR